MHEITFNFSSGYSRTALYSEMQFGRRSDIFSLTKGMESTREIDHLLGRKALLGESGDELFGLGEAGGQVLLGFNLVRDSSISPTAHHLPLQSSSYDHCVARSVCQDVRTRHRSGARFLHSGLDLVDDFKSVQATVYRCRSLGISSRQEDRPITALQIRCSRLSTVEFITLL